jgi:hypothetical protein
MICCPSIRSCPGSETWSTRIGVVDLSSGQPVGGAAPATAAVVASDAALADPSPFVAVTRARKRPPTSPLATV